MKNYIVLFLSCSFVCTQAMQESDDYIPLDIKLIGKDGKVLHLDKPYEYRQKHGFVSVEIGPNTTWYDIQDQLREKIGPGNITMRDTKQTPIGERGEKSIVPGTSLETNKPIRSNIISGWRDTPPELMEAMLTKHAGFIQVGFKLAQ